MKTKILNDPVYGFIRIPSPLIFHLVEHRWFQRLRRIKQMAFAHYVYPGALHTRFHHALGAMHLMQRAIQTLNYKGVHLTGEDAEGLLIAILLHDIGHGPYSHTLEGVLLDQNHEEITLRFMNALNEEFSGKLDNAIAIFSGKHPKPFLHELITGQLDIDRMDYLKRDSFYSGVTEGDIGHDRILYMLDVRDDHIVVEEKGVYSVEQFLFARKLMYWQVYLHKAVLSVDSMLKRAFSVLKEELHGDRYRIELPVILREMLLTGNAFFGRHPEAEALDLFARVDDVDIVYTLKQLQFSEQPVLAMLARGILDRRLFALEMHGEPPPEERIHVLIEHAAAFFDLPPEQAARLIIRGEETIPTYKRGTDEILMLMKNGSVEPFSRLRNITEDSVTRQYFLCYPKELRGQSFTRH